MSSELLSITRAAEIIGISPRTAHNWAVQGRLPIVRDGDRIVRVPALALRAWLAAQEREAVENIGRTP